jgi:hypothetical protein
MYSHIWPHSRLHKAIHTSGLPYSHRPAVFSPVCRILTGPPYSHRPAVFSPVCRILTGLPYSHRPAVFSLGPSAALSNRLLHLAVSFPVRILKEREREGKRGQGSRSRSCSLGLEEFIQVHTDVIDTCSQSENPSKELTVLRTLLKIKRKFALIVS